MRDFLKSSGRWLRTGWVWPLALLALPNCVLDSRGHHFGEPPATSAVMCDIPKVTDDGGSSKCATAADVGGMPMAHAAVALVDGDSSSVVLDFSEDATNGCGGFPRKTEFFKPFPDGLAVCLNCGQQIPSPYADSTAVCVAKCKDLINVGGGPIPTDGTDAYCAANARVSTNFNKDMCFDNACADGGTPVNFVDPRRTPEKIMWADPIGTDDFAGSNSLKRTALTMGSGTEHFDAGAASVQLITTGDAWVEFEAGEPGLSHVLGVRESCDDILVCPDMDPSLDKIGFAISLNVDNQVYVLESDGDGDPAVHGPFGLPYTKGERFRVRVKDKNDKTVAISYSRFGPCTPGPGCTEEVFFLQQNMVAPKYPLRVDTSFREQDATLEDVTIVRIKQ